MTVTPIQFSGDFGKVTRDDVTTLLEKFYGVILAHFEAQSLSLIEKSVFFQSAITNSLVLMLSTDRDLCPAIMKLIIDFSYSSLKGKLDKAKLPPNAVKIHEVLQEGVAIQNSAADLLKTLKEAFEAASREKKDNPSPPSDPDPLSTN